MRARKLEWNKHDDKDQWGCTITDASRHIDSLYFLIDHTRFNGEPGIVYNLFIGTCFVDSYTTLDKAKHAAQKFANGMVKHLADKTYLEKLVQFVYDKQLENEGFSPKQIVGKFNDTQV